MVRSMYSGVAGMKAHQVRMDVIGNNIANVNTYGFKSSRATFRDVYYQSMRNAAEGTGTRGGLNPSQVGYGSTIGSIDVMHTQSVMTTTGNPLDVAITGDGFLQVQDPDGNIFYTKAGMLNIDSYGNLIDSNGNFVLGVSGNPLGQPSSSNKIQLTVPSVDPTAAAGSNTLNGIAYTLKASKESTDGNLSFNIMSSNEMPIGKKAEAVITSSGINIVLNAKENFANLDELNNAINEAIRSANGSKNHPAGEFSLEMNPAVGFSNLTGAEITGKNFGIKEGTLPIPAELKNLFSVAALGDKFSGEAEPTFSVVQSGTGPDFIYDIEVSIAGGETYTSTLTSAQMKDAGSVVLKSAGGEVNDTITLNYPTESALLAADNPTGIAPGSILGQSFGTGGVNATPSTSSKELGLSSKPFKLEGGTEGGVQTVSDLTGLAIGADGTIVASHPVHGMLELGRIDLATFENPQGLAQSGNTYFTETPNSGQAKLTAPGLDGTGALATSALEMSNVDLSQEFADMITTQRGFQANSRLITVSDTMLEELINLKR
ncbi:MAG: flagellar hook-basal body complex protein [Angelakisella sp.]|nr:flagellar hook-basal body complex protein [Angelakisella sp.]